MGNIENLEVVKLIYDFKKNDSILWVEKNDIQLLVSDDFKSQELKNTIIRLKPEIVKLLNANKIFSKKDFLNKRIFKTDLKACMLSFSQERLWFFEQYEEGTNAYHIADVYVLDENANKEGVKYALQEVVSRHEVLRSTIEQGENQARGIQRVHDAPLSIETVTLNDTKDYNAIIKEETNRPFDLTKEYPIRAIFYTITSSAGSASTKTLLLINLHHIASDGWSTDVFEKDLFAYYEAYCNNDKTFHLPSLDIQYKDYALWQKYYLTESILKTQITYWKEKLTGYQNLELPTDYPRPDKVNYAGGRDEFKINKKVSKKLRELAQKNGITLNSVMLSTVNILLHKYSGQEDIVIGTVNANRHHWQTEELIGFFVNTQICRTILNKSQTFEELVQQVHNERTEAQLHRDLPYERLIDELGVERDLSRHPVFQVMFGVQSFGNNVTISSRENYIKPYAIPNFYDVEKFDLSIFIDDSQEELIGEISYATVLFHKDAITRLVQHYVNLLEQITETPTKFYSEFSLLTSKEYQQIIYDWNSTDKEYPKDKTIYQLFEEQVKKTPNNIALVYEEQELTYEELNKKSNQLAKYIGKKYKERTQKSLSQDTLIALCLDRSLEMVIGILAIMKAGGAYVPIDPSYPKDRIDFMLEDSQAEFILSQKTLNDSNDTKLPLEKVIPIDLTENLYEEQDSSDLPSNSKATNLACVIYTSGTTGKPKGVMLEHFSLINRVLYMIEYSEIKESDYYLFKTNYVFDVSFSDLFTHLLVGAKLQVTKYTYDLGEINKLLLTNKFTSLHLVPSQCDLVSATINKLDLEKIYFSGEALTIKILSDLNKDIKVYNYYGPTEVGEITVSNPLAPADASIIGKIFPNCHHYVLDPYKTPVPIGVVGELYISGTGLSRGYLNRPELTAERFVTNPFSTEEDKVKNYTRMYKTGDLVKWLPDGNLVYIGRNDDQIKIRGHRIELGEIEYALTQIEGIKQACVLVKEKKTEAGSIKFLAGYYTGRNSNETLNHTLILEKLSRVLPEYMIPASLMAMETFPLTINGKLDKRALPDPDFNLMATEYIAPTNETEKEVCEIWEKLLGLAHVGVTDDFFKLGGNSILAIQVSHRMTRVLGCQVKVADVFKYKTIAQLLIHVKEQSQITIPKINSNQSILSFSQERLFFIEQYQGGTNIYHIPELFQLRDDTNVEGMKYAVQMVIERHEVLRSTIEQGELQEYGIQRVHDAPLAIEEIDLKDTDDYESWIKQDINKPFNLSKDYPIRVTFYNIKSSLDNSQNKRLLLINAHHIAYDGWSSEIIGKELYAYYGSYMSRNRSMRLPALDIQYKDYAAWQRNYLTGEALEKQLSYWKDKLSGYQNLEFPTDYIRPGEVDYRGAYGSFKINKEISRKLRELAQKNGVTLNSVMLSTINILLHKYSGQDDIIIGTVNANRHYRQTEGLIGFFVNTQVNRTILNGAQNFEALVQQVHREQTEIQLHQDLPFEKLVDALGVERDPSRHPIFQIMFVFQSFGQEKNKNKEQKAYLQPYELKGEDEPAKFDLSFFINDGQEELLLDLSYATSLFHKETIARLVHHYTHLLEQLTEAPTKFYSEFSLLTPNEQQQIIYDWNATDKAYPKDKTIYELFQHQVMKTPDNIAVVYEGQKLSYQELNEKSNQLACHIRAEYKKRAKQVLAPDTLIVLCLDRSLELVIGMLAVLKAGGAYVPIDPNYPQDRIDYILEDTQAKLILSQRHLSESKTLLPQDRIICIDLTEDLYNEETVSNLPLQSKANNLAYVIYTSGTTGKPKASLIEHHSFVNLNTWYSTGFDLTESDSFIVCSEICFDLTQKNFFSPLINGGIIYIPHRGSYDPHDIATIILANNVSRINCAPSAFTPILDEIYKQQDSYSFDYIFLGGEPIPDSILRIIKTKMSDGYFVNTYGPTECTDVTTYFKVPYKDLPDSTIPLGVPVTNFKHYILNLNNIPVPIGVIGELYIAGAGVGRGYLNRPELTAERFMPNPFATQEDKAKGYTRMYKTGDVVRWLADGNIEYLGRNDDQVKIRGYRIELGEIENAMLLIEGIKQACVLAKERKTETGSTKYLVGYYVLDSTSSLNQTAILDQLSQVLPEYMVPASLLAMESFPLTINGKLDKRALPNPDFNSVAAEHVAPATEIEKEVCEIWKKLLGLEQVGITNDFFRLGGNSILALQVSHRMSKLLGCQVKVSDVFKYKTIVQLLTHVKGQSQITIPKINSNQAVLSFAQERLFFIEQYEGGTHIYNIAELFQLSDDTSVAGIKHAVQKVVERHEVLRSTINKISSQEQSVQVVHNAPLTMEEIDLRDTDDYELLIKQDINKHFNLSKEYPIRVTFYTINSASDSQSKRLLLINIHHIANDGWSSEIFENELYAYYKSYISNDRSISLPPLNIQYKDYAVWQRNYLTGKTLEKQFSFWKNKLSGYQNLEFPTDYARTGETDYKGASESFTISKEVSQKLKSLAQKNGVGLNSVLLSAITILFNKYTGQEDIVIGGLTANRHHQQTEGLLGFFVNTQANRTILNATQNFKELIQQVHEEQAEIQLHQDLPFEKLVDALGVERDLSRHPIFQVMFMVQSFGQEKNMPAEQRKYLKLYELKNAWDVARFDLSIYIDDSGDAFSGRIVYATSLFHKDTITRFINHYTHLLDQLVEEPSKPYAEISLLTPEENKQIIYDWNESDKEYTKDRAFIELFEAQVHKIPHDIAVVFEGTSLTYQQLHEESNKLANYLITNFDPQPNEFIGIMLDRSEKTVISILAVLKAGAAYACIDPEYPSERKKFMVEDTALRILITQSDYMFDLDFYTGNLFAIDIQLNALDTSLQSPVKLVKPEDLAYAIYTSGTTGRPKGVMVEHHQIVSFACENNFIDFGKTKVIAGMSNFAFDGSVFDLFFSLINGKKLVLIDKQSLLDLSRLDDQFIRFKIDTVFITTALFNSLVQNESMCLGSLQQIQFGGERCNLEIINKFKSSYKTTSLIHVYGPTENIVFSTYCNLNDYNTKYVAPIGKHLSDKKLYVLNQAKIPVPVGVVGELYVGGAGVARGYLNRPDLTSERFIHNPFATDMDKAYGFTRMYKTGDLVRWLSDGNIEYIGRNDEQVKIRGHRIELSEIENVLMQMDGIKLACVVAKERKTEAINSKYIVAYYIPDNGNDAISQIAIQSELAKMLPEYMIPSVLVEMESFPLNPNGKLDKRALPDPEFSSAKNYVAPTTPLEMQICAIWQEVLGLDKVGITDNFFNIGGDSIISIRLVSKMQQSGLNVSVREIFNRKTIQDLLKYMTVSDLKKEKEYTAFSLINEELRLRILKENNLQLEQIQDLYPASYLQSGMLVETFAKGNTNAYHIVDSFDINSPFDETHFKNTWQGLINKHGLLRTAFVLSEIGYVNVVYKSLAVDSKLTIKNQFKDQELIVRAERLVGLDMASAGLFRLVVLPDDTNERFSLIFTQHHAIIDGWSLASIISEFTDAYLYHKNDNNMALPAYGKFIGKELEALENNNYKKFWMEHLEGYELKSNNLKLNKTTTSLNEQLSVYQELPSELNDKIMKLTKKLNVSPDVVFLSVYNLVLSMLYNTTDLVIGRTVNNRLEEDGGDNVFGVHLNTLPIRFKTEGIQRKSAKEYLSEVFNDKLTVNDYKLYPYAKIKADLNFQENIYQCSFNYVHFHIAEKHFNNESVIQQHGESSTSLPVTLNVIRTGVSFRLAVESFTHFMDTDTANRLLRSMILYLEQMTADPDKLMKDYKLLVDEEYTQLVYQWNATDKEYAKDKLLHELFEEQVLKTPNNIAIVFNGEQLSYKELNEKSNQLARQLRDQYKKKTKKELSPDTLIALYLDRSLEMVIGILSILKAGGAYVPIDPGYPKDRLDYMLEDTQAELILSQKHLSEINPGKLPQHKIIYIDLMESVYTGEDTSNLIHNSKSTDLAYIIYTSGTTGRPKGVMVEHSSVINLIQDLCNKYNIEPGERFLLFSNYVFDASVEQLFLSLLSGGKLFTIDTKSVLESTSFEDFVVNNGITHVHATPSYLSSIDPSAFKQVKRVVFGAEYLSMDLFSRYRKNIPTVINEYGPTETTITSLTSINSHLLTKPIIQNTRAYILDVNRNPVPFGVTGELYIGGAGVARGYLNRPELTEERFVKNPFATQADKVNGYTKLYKTGDLVRWQADGTLEYIGRNDDQVKIRGYRIELGEIENALGQMTGIKQACVLAKERQTESGIKKYLVGYYVVDGHDSHLNANSIQEKLSEVLPEYMIPSHLIRMDSFPLTVNGKLNKYALPDVDSGSLESDYAAATTKAEKEICEIWQDLLGLSQVGITNDFFKIGGDSILAIQVSHRMSKLLGRTVKVADIFRFKSIKTIIENLEKKSELVQPFQVNHNPVLPDLIFIHPGAGGSESYQGLSEMLCSNFNCIGIDNYNMHHAEKISSLNKIANHYLSAFEEKYVFKKVIHLLGWSLGGTIALEMAAILEARGFENIHVILLDTFVQDGIMISFQDEKYIKESRMAYKKRLIAANFDAFYRETLLAVNDVELKIARTEISSHLKHTQVLLFKANQVKWFNDFDDATVKNNYVLKLTANNVNLKVDHIQAINLDCTHENILELGKEAIAAHLLSEQFENASKKAELEKQGFEFAAS